MISKKHLPGILFTLAIGIVVFVSTYFFSFLNSIILGLLLGIFIGNIRAINPKLDLGISLIGSKALEFSILFLAFGINYTSMGKLGWKSFVLIVFVVFSMVLITVYLAKKMNCPSTVGWMIGFGTAICGSSAIAALAPSIQNKNKADVGVAMAVVNLYGTIGMLLFPLILALFSFSTLQSSLILGGTLHSVGNVVGAGFTMSSEIGEQALAIKLARISLLSPGLILFNYITQRNTIKNWKQHFQLPWYLWGFMAITILVSIVDFPKSLLDGTSEIGKILLTLAMIAIGLRVSFAALLQSGKRGLIFGLLLFIVQSSLVLLGIWILRI
jgi:uncharacterized integral membrane protein (TIGR00698 family)